MESYLKTGKENCAKNVRISSSGRFAKDLV